MSAKLHHESLIVYRQAIEFVGWVTGLLEDVPAKFSVKDQLLRASESVALNIAIGNAGQDSASQLQSIEYASASVAECAACLDVLSRIRLAALQECEAKKRDLLRNFRMLVALRKRWESRLEEDDAAYGEPRFMHESLECYRLGLELLSWSYELTHSRPLPARITEMVDRSTTGLLLNIAEGNARLAARDRARFFDQATKDVFRLSAALDIAVSRQVANVHDVENGKTLAAVIASQVLGLRRKELS